ncbi:MAG: SIMPL domain-containing protein [Polyangiales bacterium]
MHRPLLPRITQLAISLGLIALTGCTTMHHPHHGGHHAPSSAPGLTVVGTGEAKAAPDVARSSIGIEVRNESAEAATGEANERMAAVIAAIKGAGVADGDVRTHDFSIQFERDFTPPQPVVQVQTAPPGKGARAVPATPTPPTPPEPRGIYRVSNTVEVTVRDIAKVSQVLTAATRAGANNVWGVSFELSDRAPLHQKARAQAIANARRDAEELAKLTGVKLGRIVSIDDQAEGGGQPVYARSVALAKSADTAVPIEQGELTVTHQVRIVYALDHDDD